MKYCSIWKITNEIQNIQKDVYIEKKNSNNNQNWDEDLKIKKIIWRIYKFYTEILWRSEIFFYSQNQLCSNFEQFIIKVEFQCPYEIYNNHQQ